MPKKKAKAPSQTPKANPPKTAAPQKTPPAQSAPASAGPNVKAARKQQRIESAALETRGKALALCGEAYVLAMIAVFPLYLSKEKYFGLVQHKADFLWVVTLIFAAALALVALAFLGVAKNTGKTSWKKLLYAADIAVLSYIACLFLSCVFSPLTAEQLGTSRFDFFLWGNADPGNPRLEGMVTRLCYLTAYFAASRLFRPKERDWAIFAASATVLALIGYFQFIGNDIFDLFPYEHMNMTHDYAWLDIIFRTTLGNVDVLSAYVGIAVPFFLVLYCKGKTKLRFLYLGAVITNFMLMVLSGADGGILAVVASGAAILVLTVTDRGSMTRLPFALGLSGLSCCLFVSAAFDARDQYALTGELRSLSWSGVASSPWLFAGLALLAVSAAVKFIPFIPFNPKRYRLAGLAAAGLIIVGGVAGLEAVGSRIENSNNVIYQARQALHGNLHDSFGSGRGMLWKRTLPAIAENPVFGTGPDTFEYAYASFQRESAEITRSKFDKAHNDVLEIAACSGLLGLAAYLALIVCAALKAIPRLQTSPWILAASMAAFGFFVQSLFGVSVPLVTPLFFVMLGAIVSMSREVDTA